MELKQYAALLWRWGWLIVLATIIAGGAAYFTSRAQTPIFKASTSLLIDQAPSTQTSEYTGLLISERLAKTYTQMITDPLILEETSRRLNNGVDTGMLKNLISAELIRDTQLIELSVEYPSAVTSAEITNTLAQVFIEQNILLQASRFSASKDNLSAQLEDLDSKIEETYTAISELGNPRSENARAQLEQVQNELLLYQSSYTTTLQSYEALRLAEAQTTSNVVQLAPAGIPRVPIRPRVLTNTVLASIVGAMLALGVIFLIEYLDDSIKSTEQATEALGLPIIGFFARIGNNSERSPFVALEPRSPISEAFRSLRSNIQFAGVDHPVRTLLITSPGPEEGKSTIAANLALVMAQSGKSVVLVDADMRKPRIHSMMGIPNRNGLSDFFKDTSSDLKRVLKQWQEEDLFVVPTGDLPPNPAELLASEKMSKILDMFKGKYDFVVVDSPPVNVVTDPSVLSARVDGTLLVVEPKKTKLGAAEHAVEQLRRAGANLIGMVFNNVPINRAGYYTGYYGGYYYYQYASPYVDGKDGKVDGVVSSPKKKRKVKGRKG